MKIEITVSYPWSGIEEDKVTIEVPDDISEHELSSVCFDYAVDTIFDRGVSWDYKEIE